MTSDSYRYAHIQIELCVLALLEDRLCVLLVRPEYGPAQDKWVLPSGDLRTLQDADLGMAAERVARDIAPGAISSLKQQGALGGAKRDFKHAWTLGVVYRAVVNHGLFTPIASIRAHNQRWLPVSDLNNSTDIATGYKDIIGDAVADLRREVKALVIPFQLLPTAFTLADLQLLCEQILGDRLDRASFRRRVLEAKKAIVQTAGGKQTGQAFRPAQYYRAAG